jgi:OOP family OmpA-OmpF porin
MTRWMMRAGLLAALLGVVPAMAQDKPMREDQVTEAGLVEALGGDLDDSARAANGVRTRGFRPVKAAAGKPGGAPGAQRQAPLLITFISDSAELMPSAKAALDVVARALRSEKLAAANFRIEGHADPRGGEEHNMDLSTRRAESVVSYLVQQHGIPAERLQPVGKGASELLNQANKAAPENRRVTIVVR